MNKVFYVVLLCTLSITHCNGMWGRKKQNPIAEGMEHVGQGLNDVAEEIKYRSRELEEAAREGNEDRMLNAITFGLYNYFFGPQSVQAEKEFTSKTYSYERPKNKHSYKYPINSRKKKIVEAHLMNMFLSGTSFCGCLCATLYGLKNLFHNDSSKIAAFLSCTIGTSGMLGSAVLIFENYILLERYFNRKKHTT